MDSPTIKNLDIIPIQIILSYLSPVDRARFLLTCKFFTDDIHDVLSHYIDFKTLLHQSMRPLTFNDIAVEVCLKYVDEDILETLIIYNRPRLVSVLLAKGNININKPLGGIRHTALMKASANGYERIVNILLQAGATINDQNIFGETALVYASVKGQSKIIKTLLEAGANPNITDKLNHTALIHASMRGCKDIVWNLVKHGADINVRDNSGKTALAYAKLYNHRYISLVLECNDGII